MLSMITASRPAMDGIAVAAQLQLCRLDESSAVRVPHVAALLACAAATQQFSTAVLRVRFEHRPTARWALGALNTSGTKVFSNAEGVTIAISDPRTALRNYGFRGEQCWSFGHTPEAALGAARGAVHAGARFTLHGLKLPCPTPPLMLTMATLMQRLGINAAPSSDPVTGMPRVSVGPNDTADALHRLGLSVAGEQYGLIQAARHERQRTNVNGYQQD